MESDTDSSDESLDEVTRTFSRTAICPCSENGPPTRADAGECEKRSQLFSALVGADMETLDTMATTGQLGTLITFYVRCTTVGGYCKCNCGHLFECFIGSPEDLKNTFIEFVSTGACNHYDNAEEATIHSTSFGFRPVKPVASSCPGVNALHLAVMCGNTDLVKWLLNEGKMRSEIHTTTGYLAFTPLHLAVIRSNCDIVRLLVEEGADIHAISNTNHGLALLAVKRQCKEILEYLMEKGVDINLGVPDGPTPILCAVREGTLDMVRLLVAAGVDQLQTGFAARSLLYNALSNRDVEDDRPLDVANELLKGECHVTHELNARSPLLLVIFDHIYQDPTGFTELVKKLLELGVDPNRFSSTGQDYTQSPLLIAIIDGYHEVAKLLIAHGADVNRTDHSGYSALHLAAWEGYTDICKLLLESGAAHDTPTTGDRNTPLSLACHGDCLAVIQLLLQRPCEVNAQDKDDDTPLLYSTCNGNYDASRLLLEHGADPALHSKAAVTPLWYAVYAKNLRLVHLILQYNVPVGVRSRGVYQHSHTGHRIFTTVKSPLEVVNEIQDLEPNRWFQLFRVLILAGAPCNTISEPWLQRIRHPVVDEEEDAMKAPVYEKLRDLISAPLSLKCITRIAIRVELGTRLRSVAYELELPTTLVDYLLFKDV